MIVELYILIALTIPFTIRFVKITIISVEEKLSTNKNFIVKIDSWTVYSNSINNSLYNQIC